MACGFFSRITSWVGLGAVTFSKLPTKLPLAVAAPRVGHHRVERPRRVLGGGLLTVRPLGVVTDRVRPGQLVRGGLPLGGEPRYDVVVLGVVVGQVLVRQPVDARAEQPYRQERAERVDALRHGDGEHLVAAVAPVAVLRRDRGGDRPRREEQRAGACCREETGAPRPVAGTSAAVLIVSVHDYLTSRHRTRRRRASLREAGLNGGERGMKCVSTSGSLRASTVCQTPCGLRKRRVDPYVTLIGADHWRLPGESVAAGADVVVRTRPKARTVGTARAFGGGWSYCWGGGGGGVCPGCPGCPCCGYP